MSKIEAFPGRMIFAYQVLGRNFEVFVFVFFFLNNI